MSNINKAITSEKSDEDEDRLFCLSLVKNLKDLDSKHKSYAKMQILKINMETGQYNPVCYGGHNTWFHHHPQLHIDKLQGRPEELP